MRLQITDYRLQKSAPREAPRALPTTNYQLPTCRTRGITVMLVLAFMGIFAVIMGTVTSYTLTQSTVGRAKYAKESAFQIAEAGLEYYKWFLAHNPGDLQNGEGSPGPYTYVVNDPEGGRLGEASLSIEGNSYCGDLQSVDITSEGSADADPQFKRTLFARHAKPSVAQSAYIINSNVWAGEDRNIVGPYHSNGGIRMDGTNNSTVTSAVEDWLCTSSFGCSPDQTVDGVWGSGSGSALWNNPVSQVDFAGMTTDLSNLKTKAQASGVYLPNVGVSDRNGWHITMNSDGTITARQVTGTLYVWSIHTDNLSEWVRDYHYINQEGTPTTYTLSADCPVVFAEDKVWLDGTVNGKVTVVSAYIQGGGFDPDIVLQGNIDYTTGDGTDGLTAIAEHSIHIGYNVPDDMSLKGVFVAEGGYYGRNLYPCWYAHDQKNSLTMHGSIVSNQRVGTKWGYSGAGCGNNQWSGFQTRTNTYDRLLAHDPPPFTPAAGPDEEFILWREE